MLANGEKCRKMEETQEIGVWVIGVMAVNEEQVDRPWDGDSGAELAWSDPAWQSVNGPASCLMCTLWRRGYGHSQQSPVCRDPTRFKFSPHTVKVSDDTQKAQSKSGRMTLKTAHPALQTRSFIFADQISPQHNPPTPICLPHALTAPLVPPKSAS